MYDIIVTHSLCYFHIIKIHDIIDDIIVFFMISCLKTQKNHYFTFSLHIIAEIMDKGYDVKIT
jgi:hypothetical protein